MSKRKYTLEQFQQAVLSSQSIAQVLLSLGLAPKGGNYKVLYRYAKYYNIDITHLQTGHGWNRGLTTGPKRSIDDYLSNKQSISSFKLKIRLLKENIFEHKCSKCNLNEWLNKPIPLELHHKDGNNENNNLSNLELLCPNCHALTDTYRGKNQERSKA